MSDFDVLCAGRYYLLCELILRILQFANMYVPVCGQANTAFMYASTLCRCSSELSPNPVRLPVPV